MTTILKMFGTGQITLPKVWRKQFKTHRFVARTEGKHVVIATL